MKLYRIYPRNRYCFFYLLSTSSIESLSKIAICHNNQKNNKHSKKQKKAISARFIKKILDFFESLGYIEPSNFSDGLNLSKEAGVSVIFLLFLLGHYTPNISGVFKLTKRLESPVPERMLAISLSQKLDIFNKGSAVNQKGFPFSSVLLKLEYNTDEWYFSSSALSNSKGI